MISKFGDYYISFLVSIVLLTCCPVSFLKCLMRNQISPAQNGYYTGDAIPLNSTVIFIKRCSSLLKKDYKEGNPISTCCSENQLEELDKMLVMLDQFLTNCDVCADNIQMLSCSLMCREDQSEFGKVHLVENNKSLVDGFTLAMSYRFAEGIFNSCKDVKETSTKLPITKVLCSVAARPFCGDPVSLIEGLLSASTFKITPIILNASSSLPPGIPDLLNPEASRCNQTYNRSGLKMINKCRCLDCDSTCPPIPDFTPPIPYRIFNKFTIYQFSIMIILIFIILFYIIFSIKFFVKYFNEQIVESDQFEAQAYHPLFNQSFNDDDRLFQSNVADKCKTPYILSQFVQSLLFRWAVLVANHKIIFFVLPLIFIIIMNCGLITKLQLTSDPVDIWSPPNSNFKKQKNFFDNNFGPFYRTEFVLIKVKDLKPSFQLIDSENKTIGPVFKKEIISELFKIQETIATLSIEVIDEKSMKKNNITLNDICYKALEPVSSLCTIFSISQYFQNNVSVFESYAKIPDLLEHINRCILVPTTPDEDDQKSCLSDISAPVVPELIFGGYAKNPFEANTLVITYVVNNYVDHNKIYFAKAWESQMIKFLKAYSNPLFEISFSTERSIEDEINRDSKRQYKTILGSYGIMILYVTFALGRFTTKSFKCFLIQQKFLVGFLGVILVLASVTGTFGFFCYIKYKTNMIVLEVLPFLLLAVGVDNIFLLVHEFRRNRLNSPYGASVKRIIAETFAGVGHGMIISAIAQIATFSIGAMSNIPAVKNFSISAVVAMIISFLIQLTLFLCIFAVDCIRECRNSPDICWFLEFSDENADDSNDIGMMEKIFTKLSVFVFDKRVKSIILLTFIIVWGLSLFAVPSIQIGLDQTSALPSDSYLIQYFKDVFNLLKVGPPVYFMIYPGYDYKQKKDMLCSGIECNSYSLTNFVYHSSKNSNYTKIATSADSWIDSYHAWLQPSLSCCNYKFNGTMKEFCPAQLAKIDDKCQKCFDVPSSGDIDPTTNEFYEYLPWFLIDIPNKDCIYGGKPLFGKLVSLNPEYYEKKNSTAQPVLTSAFMTYHTPLTYSEDITDALKAVLSLSKNISQYLNHDVIPYSSFYIFFESYLTIWKDTFISFGISIATIFVINLFLYGFDFRMTFLMTFLTYVMILVDIGLMYILNIRLNPVSLVNLIMFVGFNTEFLSHIGRMYMSAEFPSRATKAKVAFTHTGSTVFSGIAMTKILGISVLYFSTSLLFKEYYFKMYACAILVGALHGIIILPILLSYFGPESLPTTEYNEERENTKQFSDDNDNILIIET